MATKILAADDDPLIGEMLTDFLGRLGYEVTIASDGLSVLTLFHKVRPALVILDFQMPAGNGADALRKIRLLEGGNVVPVIFLTGAPQSALLGELPNDPLIRLYHKPVDLNALEAALRELLGPRAHKSQGG